MSILILVPCEKSKKPVGGGQFIQPSRNLQRMRNTLQTLVQNTPQLSGKQANNKGILNAIASLTPAYDLYNGKFFKKARGAIKNLATGKLNNPGIHILIVSSFYGLIQIDEGIKNYEMDLPNSLSTMLPGVKTIGDYWHSQNIHNELANYVNNNSITNIWSLLSKPYHNLFRHCWDAPPLGVWCCHVFPKGKRQAAPYYRGLWLDYLYHKNQQYFNATHHYRIHQINGCDFDYRPC